MAQWVGQVAASADDAKQAGTTMTLTDTVLTLTAGTQWWGFRFTGCTIPAKSVINSAILTIYVPPTRDDPAGMVIYGCYGNDARVFETASNDISTRTMTTASVAWTGTNIGTNATKNSPDLKTIIQEMVDYGLGSGDVVLLVDAVASTDINARAYDGYPADAAQLTIDYTPPAALPIPRRPRTYVRM